MKDIKFKKTSGNSKARDEQGKNSDRYIDFYRQLILINGGSIILSVTFLGYVSNTTVFKGDIMSNIWILVLSWICFMLSLLSSLLRNIRYIEYLQIVALEFSDTINDNSYELISKNKKKKEKQFAFFGTFALATFVFGIWAILLFAIKVIGYF